MSAETLAITLAQVTKTWADWLRQHRWDWWCTLTFRTPPTDLAATKLFGAWTNWLSRKTYGRNYYRYHKGVRWVRGREFQKRGAIHYHALLAGVEVPILDAARKWYKLTGETPVIQPYDPSKGAVYYLLKRYNGPNTGKVDLGGRWATRSRGSVRQLKS